MQQAGTASYAAAAVMETSAGRRISVKVELQMSRDKRAAGTVTPTRSSCTTLGKAGGDVNRVHFCPRHVDRCCAPASQSRTQQHQQQGGLPLLARRTFRPQQDGGNSASKQLGDYCSRARLSRAAAAPAASAPQAAGPDAIDPAACTVLATRTPHGRPPLGLGEPQARRREEAMRSAPKTTTESRSQRGPAAPRGASSLRPARAAFTHPATAGTEGGRHSARNIKALSRRRNNNEAECFSVKRFYLYTSSHFCRQCLFNCYLVAYLACVHICMILSPLQTAQFRRH